MKNIIQFIFVLVLCSVQYTLNAQRTLANPCESTSMDSAINAHYTEIDARLAVANQRIADICTGINLTLDGNNEPQNFVVLNDRDDYTQNGSVNNWITYNCNWPMIYEPGNSLYSHIEYIILTPGDYRDYLTFYPEVVSSNTSTRYLLYYPGDSSDPTVIQEYFNYDPSDASDLTYCEKLETAIEQEEGERAIVENFKLNATSVSGALNWTWVIMGITFRGNHANYYSSDYSDPVVPDCQSGIYTGGTDNIITSSGNIISHCLLENTIKPHFIRIGDGDNNIITNNVIRNRHDMSHRDVMGITLSASYGEVAENNIIMNNDIYNVGDAIQTIYDPACRNKSGVICNSGCPEDGIDNYCNCSTSLSQKGTIPGTFIHNNRLFNQKIYEEDGSQDMNDGSSVTKTIEKMHGEGAIDLKAGGTPDNKVIVSENYIYGWRHGRTSDGGNDGGNGHAIITHGKAQDIVIINNKIKDCANGIHINTRGAFPVRDFVAGQNCETIEVKDIEVYDNNICDLYNPFDVEIRNLNASIPLSHGTAIRVAIPTAIVAGNNVRNAARGVYLEKIGDEAGGYFATIFDNYFEDITNQALIDPARPFAYDNFNCNIFVDADYSCSDSDDVLESTLEDQNNCFLRQKTRSTVLILNPYEEDDVCQ